MDSIVVTGGSRGLGLAISRELVRSGFRVIAVARHPTEQLRCAQAEFGDWLHFCPWDLSQLASLRTLALELRQRFGTIYGLVNNVGVGTHGMLTTMPDSEIERLIRINTLAPVLLTKYVMRSMLRHRRGRIVNISSIAASKGVAGAAVYAATKASLEGFTRAMAREVGELGIAVNAVAPGFVATEMTRSMTEEQAALIAKRSALKRSVTAEDIAGAVAWLMGEQARNVTGTVVTVDAGSTA